MKRFIILIIALVNGMIAVSQSFIQVGDRCFTSGAYACAVLNYEKAFNNLVGRDKQLAEIKLTRAKWCLEHIVIAHEAYAAKDFHKAKENFQKVLDSNPDDSNALTQLTKCNIELHPIITLSLSKQNLSFSSEGGIENIDVSTNADSYSFSEVPFWCTIRRNVNYFSIHCSENLNTSQRNAIITISAGDKILKVRVNQLGKVEKKTIETYLVLSKSELRLSAFGDRSEKVFIYSNSNEFSVVNIPPWIRVEKYNDYIVVKCIRNNSSTSRTGSFSIKAGNKEVKITVFQEGEAVVVQKTERVRSYYYFNKPKTKDTWGLTIGYINRDLSGGIQLGIKAEPLYRYGFGMNTGLNIEVYTGNDKIVNSLLNRKVSAYAVNIPLHMEYRLNFSKWFNLFIYGGAGFYAFTDIDFKSYLLPFTFDYGGGIRINHIQFNLGRGLYLGDLKNINAIGKKGFPFNNYAVSISVMF